MRTPAYAGPERRRFVNRSWPLPALVAWAAAWIVFAATSRLGAPDAAAFIGAGLFGAALSLVGATPWRRVFIGVGFPLSFAASGAAGSVPAWAWLLPLALLAFLYPWRTWRDAPLFPTPRGALAGLARHVPIRRDQAALDGGCGLGDGVVEHLQVARDVRLLHGDLGEAVVEPRTVRHEPRVVRVRHPLGVGGDEDPAVHTLGEHLVDGLDVVQPRGQEEGQ